MDLLPQPSAAPLPPLPGGGAASGQGDHEASTTSPSSAAAAEGTGPPPAQAKKAALPALRLLSSSTSSSSLSSSSRTNSFDAHTPTAVLHGSEGGGGGVGGGPAFAAAVQPIVLPPRAPRVNPSIPSRKSSLTDFQDSGADVLHRRSAKSPGPGSRSGSFRLFRDTVSALDAEVITNAAESTRRSNNLDRASVIPIAPATIARSSSPPRSGAMGVARPTREASVKAPSARISMAPSRARTVSRPRQPDREVGTLMRISTRENFDGPTVAVGTPVREGHANYLLMYDMLTGIRVSVLRCGARPDRELEEGDFVAAHKLAFDVSGNELAPKSGYDFKFKDYSPWVFRHIRSLFNIEEDDYLVSLTGKYVLSELGSPGKSGSFFYYSQDYRFIIKTVHKSEHKFLRAILKNYYAHLQANPNTLLSRIFGLHRVKMPRKRKIHFVVMGNVFPADRDVHETYDLKGSTAGREVSEAEAADSPIKVLKDNNWVTKGRRLQLGPLKRKQLVEQIRKDAEFLERNHIMDYSLLVGFHDLATGNESNIRDKTLAVFEPNIASIHRNHSLHHRRSFSSPVSPTFPSIENLTHGRSGSARSPTSGTHHRLTKSRSELSIQPEPARLRLAEATFDSAPASYTSPISASLSNPPLPQPASPVDDSNLGWTSSQGSTPDVINYQKDTTTPSAPSILSFEAEGLPSVPALNAQSPTPDAITPVPATTATTTAAATASSSGGVSLLATTATAVLAAATLHRAATLRNPDPFRLGASAALLPDAMLPERAPFTFYREMGGFRATDARDVGVGEVYYVGIIDIFTKYDAIKRVEHFFKSLVTDGRKISAVNPHLYKARFLDFIERTAVPSAESSSATTSP